jgi:hypothetical protein
MRLRLSRPLALVLSAMLAAVSVPVSAQPSAAASLDVGSRAIEKGEQGVAFYEQGRWNEALERFREAEALYHSPVFVLYAARALRNAGRLLAARETFRQLIGERLETPAPELWSKAQRDARTELSALEALLPSAVIELRGGSTVTHVALDGRTVAIGSAIELDPGQHRAVATDSSRRVLREFSLAPGTRNVRIVIDLNPITAPAPTVPASNRPVQAERSGLYVPGLVVAAAGGTAILAGGVVGILALREKGRARDSLPAICQGTTCPQSTKPEVEGRRQRARDLGTAADILFVSGGVLAAAGIGMMIFIPGDAGSVSAQVSPRGASVRIGF